MGAERLALRGRRAPARAQRPAMPGSLAPQGGLIALQRSAGNRAVSSLVSAATRASREAPRRLSSSQQTAIANYSGGGEQLDGPLRRGMEGVVGAPLPGVRIHLGADALAERLGAKAFTYGRDVYLRSDRTPQSAEGRATLAHELRHVADGGSDSGSVLREADDVGREQVAWDLLHSPGYQAKVVRHEATGGEIGGLQPTISDPKAPPPAANPRIPQTFDIELTIDKIPKSYTGLTSQQAVDALREQWKSCHGFLDIYRKWHGELISNRESHPIVGFWADKLGNGDPPDIEIWNLLGRQELAAASDTFNSIPLNRSADERDKAYQAHKEALAKYTNAGSLDLDRFDRRSLASNFEELKRLDFQDNEVAQGITKAAELLQRAANILEARRQRVFYYKEGSIEGAERGIKVTKTSIMVIGAVATAGAGTGASTIVGGAVRAAGTGIATAEADEIGTQIGQMRYGEREWGDFDYAAIGKVGAKAAVSGFVGGVIGGGISKLAAQNFARFLTPRLVQMGVKVDSAAAKYVGELGLNWLQTVGSQPFVTASSVIMERAMGEQSVKSWGDFFDRTLNEMWDGLKMGTLIHSAESGVKAIHAGGTPAPIVSEPPVKTPVAEPAAKTTSESDTPVGGSKGTKDTESVTKALETPKVPERAAERADAPDAPRAQGSAPDTPVKVSVHAEKLAAALSPIRTEWHGLTPHQRAQRVLAEVHRALADTGLPMPEIVFNNKGDGAAFRFAQWEIAISKTPFNKSSPTVEEFAYAAELVRHEMEHGLQWWRMTRQRAADTGHSAKTISTELSVPIDIVEAAIETNVGHRKGERLRPGGETDKATRAHYESVYGQRRHHRRRIYKAMKAADQRLTRARNEHRAAAQSGSALMEAVALRDYHRAAERVRRLNENYYRHLPEEIPAWATGRELNQAVREFETAQELSRAYVAERAAYQAAEPLLKLAEHVKGRPSHHLSVEARKELDAAIRLWEGRQHHLRRLQQRMAAVSAGRAA